MKAENAAVYYNIYENEFKNKIDEKKDEFSYTKKRMIINSLLNYENLLRGREDFDARRYEEAEDFVKDMSGGAFRDAFRQFDFVISFEEDLRDLFYSDKEENKPGIRSKVKDYISKVTKASKIDLGASPFIRDRKIHFRVYTRLENMFGFSSVKAEVGTNAFEIGLVKKLDENWNALAKYEIDGYARKESEVVLGISRNFGKNLRLTINSGWGEPFGKHLDEDNERTQETYAGANLTMLF